MGAHTACRHLCLCFSVPPGALAIHPRCECVRKLSFSRPVLVPLCHMATPEPVGVSLCEHLGCFQSGTMSIAGCFWFFGFWFFLGGPKVSFFLDRYQGLELLGHRAGVCVALADTPNSFQDGLLDPGFTPTTSWPTGQCVSPFYLNEKGVTF